MTASQDQHSDGFGGFLEAAAEARRELLVAHTGLDTFEHADRESFYVQMFETALQLVDVDPARPAFVPWQTPTRRYADNGPQSVYQMAFVDEHHRYRIHGLRGGECYLSISLYNMDSGQPDRQVLSVNHIDLAAGPGESFELELTPTDGGSVVLARQYYLDPGRDAHGSFEIDVIDGPGPAPADAEASAEGWRRAARCIRALVTNDPLGDPPPRWASLLANVLGAPSGRGSDPVVGRSAVDQVYSCGPFELGDDQALILELRFPRCAYASVTLWNRFGQSVDTRFHSSILNRRSAVATDDGLVRAVVAARDPGVANWLDTGGRRRGTVFCRFLLVEETVLPIVSRVVPIDGL